MPRQKPTADGNESCVIEELCESTGHATGMVIDQPPGEQHLAMAELQEQGSAFHKQEQEVTPADRSVDLTTGTESTQLRIFTQQQLMNLTIRELEALPDTECIIVSGEFASEEDLGPGEVACEEYRHSETSTTGAVDEEPGDRLSEWFEADAPRFLAVAVAISHVHRTFVSKAEELSLHPIDLAAHLFALRRLAASIKRSLYFDPPPEIARWYSKPDIKDIQKREIRKAVEENVGPVLDRLVREYHASFLASMTPTEIELNMADPPGPHGAAEPGTPIESVKPSEPAPLQVPTSEEAALAERGRLRSAWITKMLAGRPFKIITGHAQGPSDNTLRRFRSGEKSTQDGTVRGQLSKVFECDIAEVPL